MLLRCSLVKTNLRMYVWTSKMFYVEATSSNYMHYKLVDLPAGMC